MRRRRFRSEKSPIVPQLFCSVILYIRISEDEDDDEHEEELQFRSLGSVNNSSKAQFEVHLVVYAKNKCAGISHSPTYVRHYELRARGDSAVLQVYLSVERHQMILPVNPQDAMHINLAFTLHRDLTGNAIRRKNRFGKSIAFQYGFMHLPITRCHTRVSTLYIDHDLTAGLTSCDLPANRAALDFERTVDRVQHGA